jgi:hypothetical protein
MDKNNRRERAQEERRASDETRESPPLFNEARIKRIESMIIQELEAYELEEETMIRSLQMAKDAELVGDVIQLGQIFADPDEDPVFTSDQGAIAAGLAGLGMADLAIESMARRRKRIIHLNAIRTREIELRGKRVYPLPGMER